MVCGIRRYTWGIPILALVFLVSACERCKSDELTVLEVEMLFQGDGPYVLESDLLESRVIDANERLTLPISLASDTTIYDFIKADGRRMRLALAYERVPEFENTKCGFFLNFRDPKVLPESEFVDVQLRIQDDLWFIRLQE